MAIDRGDGNEWYSADREDDVYASHLHDRSLLGLVIVFVMILVVLLGVCLYLK